MYNKQYTIVEKLARSVRVLTSLLLVLFFLGPCACSIRNALYSLEHNAPRTIEQKNPGGVKIALNDPCNSSSVSKTVLLPRPVSYTGPSLFITTFYTSFTSLFKQRPLPKRAISYVRAIPVYLKNNVLLI